MTAVLRRTTSDDLSGHPSHPEANLSVDFFSPYEQRGVIIMAVAGVLSCAFVTILLLCIAFSALSPWPRPKSGAPPPFIRKQIAVFVICLLTSDLIQSIAGITQVKWAIENRIYEGHACTIQAAALVMGDLGSTVWSCVIAAHTFSGLALKKPWSRFAVWATVVIGWIFIIVLTGIGPASLETVSQGPFFGIAGDGWCFITSGYAIPRLGIHYIPLFIAAVVIVVFYGLVFLVLRGSISFVDRSSRVPSNRRPEDAFTRERVTIAKRMLWYPVAYLMCILPITVIRLVGLRQETVSDGVWIFGMFFLYALGAVDSVIYATTRTLVKNMSFPTRRTPGRISSSRIESDESIRSKYFRDTDKHPDSPSTPTQDDYAHELAGARIHVTLERIQEII